MCSRYSLYTQQQTLEQYFKSSFDHLPFHPRYNIAPFQKILCVRENDSTPTAEYLTWGIKLNDWYRGVINARSETVASKPLFSTAFRTKRCLIIADGFYEWQHRGKEKIPSYIKRKSDTPFAFAGISGSWNPNDTTDACVILTVPANTSIQPIHSRMPVILNPTDYKSWLQPDSRSIDTATSLLKPLPASALTIHRVSNIVNSISNDTPECVQVHLPQEPFQHSLL